MNYELIVLIRDIALIIMAIAIIVSLCVLLFMTFKIFPALRRATHNLETTSDLMLNTANRVTALLTAGDHLAQIIAAITQRFLRRPGSPPSSDQPDPNT